MFTGCTISSQREIFILIGAGLIVSTVGAVVLHLFLVVVVVAASFASRNRRNMKYEQDEVSIPVTYMLTSFVFHILYLSRTISRCKTCCLNVFLFHIENMYMWIYRAKLRKKIFIITLQDI